MKNENREELWPTMVDSNTTSYNSRSGMKSGNILLTVQIEPLPPLSRYPSGATALFALGQGLGSVRGGTKK